MATPIKPNKKPILARTGWWFVPTLTTTGPLATEVNSVSGLYVTCFLLGDQEAPSGEAGKVDLPRLLCETTTTETLDAMKVTLPKFRFVWDPQAAAVHNDKKAWALLKDGYSGYAVRRPNVATATSDVAAAGQFIDWFQVQGTVGVPVETANDASGIYAFDVDFACLNFGFNVALV